MLKIGFCINSLEMGGAERLLVDIINALYETKDYEIHLLTKIKSNSYFYNLIKNKVKYSFLLEKKAKGFFAKTRESILKKINFKKFSNEVDIIIDFLDGDFFSYIRKVKDKEKIIWLHLSYETLKVRKHVDEKLSAYNKIIVIADDMEKELFKARKDLKNIYKIDNFVDYQEIDKKLNEDFKIDFDLKQKYFLTVCRLAEEQKDVKTLIEAYALYKGEEKLVIAGDGPDRKMLEDLCIKKALKDKVIFLGMVDNPFHLMKNAQAFILSSKVEGFGLVLVEALYCGTKVISSNCPTGPSQILLNGEAGELFEISNVKELLNKLEIIADKEYKKDKIEETLTRYTRENFKKNFWEQLIAFSMLVYLYFLSRRGGNSKDIVSILIMIFTLIYSYKEGIKRYLTYKKEIIISILYIILVVLSYIILDDKGGDRFYAFSHATLFSVGFMIVLLNYKLNNKYIKYILPLLLIISLPSMYRGVVDFYKHYNEISWYRLEGNTYTTKYAAELGMYLLLGIFSIIYYKKIYIKLLLIPYIFINLWLIFLTQSRNTFIAIPLAIIFLYTIVDWKKGIIILLILLCGITILFKYNHNIANINRIKNSISTVEKIKVDARYIIFLDGIEKAKNHFFIGEGFFKYRGGKLNTPIEITEHYHNIFIETAVTQGVFTLIVYITFLITLFIRMLKNYFKEDDRLKRYIKLYALAVFIFSILYGLFEPILYFEKIYQLIFTIIAISFIVDDNESKIS